MIDPQLKRELDSVRSTLKEIKEGVKPTRWQLFIQGLWRAAGYVVGLILAIVALGWILNIVGVIPFFKDTATELQQILRDMRTK